MEPVKLTAASATRLSNLLTTYVTTLQSIVEALGLEGEWQFDPLTGSLVSRADSPRGDGPSPPQP
jgi:hypothetical protein